MIIGLDISSSKTGICFLNEDLTIYKIDYVKTTTTTKKEKEKFKDLYDKVVEVVNYFHDFIKNDFRAKDVTAIYIEEPLSKFSRSMSSIHTIKILFEVNYAICHQLYKMFGIKPIHVNPITSRSINGIKVQKGEDAKQVVYNFICSKYPLYKEKIPEYSKNSPWIDVADSVVIARCGALNPYKLDKTTKSKHGKNKKNNR